MAAIITEEFRKENANLLLDDLTLKEYYVGIGNQHPWFEEQIGSPYPLGTYEDQVRVLENLTGLFKVSGKSIMIPNIALEPNVQYKVYNPLDPTCFYPDKAISLYPCFAIRNDIVYLCIHKAPSASTMDPDIAFDNAFDQVSLDGDGEYISLISYGIKTVGNSGYTWAYLGEIDKFNSLNSADFVAINTTFTPIEAAKLQADSFARALINPPGDKNDFIVTASENYPGNNGNILAIEIEVDPAATAATVDSVVETNGQTVGDETNATVIKYIVGPDTPANVLIEYINDLTRANNNIGESEHYFFAEDSAVGGGIGHLYGVGPILLSGGNSGVEYIREATGGLIHGFTVFNGGQNYFVQDIQTLGIQSVPTQPNGVTALLVGLDEFGNAREETIEVYVEWNNVTNTVDELGRRPDCHIHSISIEAGEMLDATTRPQQNDVDRLDDTYYKLRGWKSCRLTLPDWTAANGYSDPILFDPCGDQSTGGKNNVLDVRAHIAPTEGFGFNKTLNLPSWYVGVYADTSQASYIAEGTSYHQVSLIKQPLQNDGNVLGGQYYQPLPWFELSLGGSGYNPPELIRPGWRILQGDPSGGGSGYFEIGILSHIQLIETNDDRVALDPPRFYYYPSSSFGYTPMLTDPGSGAIYFRSPDGQDLVSGGDPAPLPVNIYAPDAYVPGTGKVVFQDNRSPVYRAEGQNEEVKLVIQL